MITIRLLMGAIPMSLPGPGIKRRSMAAPAIPRARTLTDEEQKQERREQHER